MANERNSPRKPADRVIPVHIEPDIDAFVLDISDGGLGFRALSPVEQEGAVRFSFVDSQSRMEASGDLVWIDAKRKKGGLSFASMSQADRDRIRHWIASPPPRATEQAASAPEEFPVPSAPGTDPAPASALMPAFLPVSLPPQDAALMPYGEPYFYESRRRGFLPGVATGIALSGVLIAVTYFALYGSSTAALLARWRAVNATSVSTPVASAASPAPATPQAAETPSAEQSTDGQAVQPVEPLLGASGSPATSAGIASLARTPADTPPARPPEENSAPASVAAAPAAEAPNAGEAELASARRYLNQNAGLGDHAAAARLLWSAVRKGNVQAEVMLGGLYALGDGVTKNCDQARVLLRAAAERGSQEGSDQLERLVRSGCR